MDRAGASPRIRIGCCGWPVGHAAYARRFGTVEVDSTFYNPPRLSTAERWRREAPPGFEFSVKAWQLITHTASSSTYRRLSEKMSEKSRSRCGNFRDTEEVGSAWERTRAVATALGARFVLFQTPASFYPGADHLRDMYRFFKRIQRGKSLIVWEPRGEAWKPALVKKVCGDLDLIHGVDPLVTHSLRGAVQYFRLHGRHEGGRIVYQHAYSDAELGLLLARCADRPTYVYFNNAAMWEDAGRFQALTLPRP